MNTIPRIGAGTFRLQDQVAYDAVTNALAVGYRHIDTAQMYGNEKQVGQAIFDSGVICDEVFITTKIAYGVSDDDLIASLRQSADDLQVDQVDLTLIHWPPTGGIDAVKRQVERLAQAKQQGLTHFIGISNFTIEQTQAAIDVVGAQELATNQIEVHPYLQNRRLVEFCHANGVAITAYMTLAYGKVMQDSVMQKIADKHQSTPAQVALAWALQRDLIVLASSTQRANLAANLKAFDLVLDTEDMQNIAALDANERIAAPDFSPVWDV